MQVLSGFKRVVTGHDAQGRSRVVQAGPVPHVARIEAVPGTLFHEVWKTVAMPVPLPAQPDDPTLGELRLGPVAQGSAVRVVDIPPDSVQNAVSEAAAAEMFSRIGGDGGAVHGGGGRHALMHRTQTLDYGIVLAGEVWLVLDEDEVLLQPGDVVVQVGTNHAWSNRTGQMARMAFILLDGCF